ncbi:hypothetical protein HMPREF9702_03247 [Delftia acidovorans CCUG 15835]|jgi:hypothetical protein|nr:hypothetical protein HMPREF9702_03247 [Delftia acidovorans CCUG 15835]
MSLRSVLLCAAGMSLLADSTGFAGAFLLAAAIAA